MMNAQQGSCQKLFTFHKQVLTMTFLTFLTLMEFCCIQPVLVGLSLLVPMSPGFGEPISLPVNYRPTDLAAIRKKKTANMTEEEVTVSKPICIEDELYKNALFDFVGITAGAQLYFAPGSLKKKKVLP